MARPNIKPEVQSFERRPDGTFVEVDVDCIEQIPQEFSELRARGTALVTDGVATPPTKVLDNIEVGEVKRFTTVVDMSTSPGKFGTVVRSYTIRVDRPY